MEQVATHVVVSRLGPALSKYEHVCVTEARRQHESLIRLLRELEIEVVEAPAGICPDSAFIGHTSFVLNGTALMARGERPDRQTDVEKTIEILQKELRISAIILLAMNARLDGGDILFTGSFYLPNERMLPLTMLSVGIGRESWWALPKWKFHRDEYGALNAVTIVLHSGREFFVGLSRFSNELGARALAETFPEFPCTPIKVPEGKLNQYVSMAGPDILCVGESSDARAVLRRLERAASHTYTTLTVPEDEAANCLYINGTLIHRAIEEVPLSFQVFCEKVDFARRSVCYSELSKISAGLTSACLLIRKTT